MTTATFATTAPTGTEYVPGACNIGPAEIRRRRRVGHLGAAATLAILAGLLVADAPPIGRLLLVVPAAVSASGYLQAWLRFCAGFGQIGIYNFGGEGESVRVADDAARAADRRRARQISLASFAIGAVVAAVAYAIPA
jgi:hypothetical protein